MTIHFLTGSRLGAITVLAAWAALWFSVLIALVPRV
jgi:hypothetical protein